MRLTESCSPIRSCVKLCVGTMLGDSRIVQYCTSSFSRESVPVHDVHVVVVYCSILIYKEPDPCSRASGKTSPTSLQNYTNAAATSYTLLQNRGSYRRYGNAAICIFRSWICCTDQVLHHVVRLAALLCLPSILYDMIRRSLLIHEKRARGTNKLLTTTVQSQFSRSSE